MGRVFGIEIRIHAAFPLFVALIAALGIGELGVRQGLSGALFVLVVFLCVLLHEISHSLAAMHLGGRVRNIVLMPIGGVARMDRIPEAPRAEMAMAVAGPAVNFALAGLLFAALPGRVSLGGGGFPSELATVNLALGTFNLLPAFPMDGGRILRALLALRVGRPAATRIAAAVGKVLAVGLAAVGLRFNPWLVLIGAFVFMGASVEERIVGLQAVVAGRTVRDLMADRIAFVPAETHLSVVRALFERSADDAFLVGDPSFPAGMVRRGDLPGLLARLPPESPAGAFAVRSRGAVVPDQPAEVLVPALSGRRGGWIAVMEDGRLVGVVTAAGLAERSAWRGAAAARGGRRRGSPAA